MKLPKRIKSGVYLRVNLPNGKYAFGRFIFDRLAIYDFFSDEPDLDKIGGLSELNLKSYAFIILVSKDIVKGDFFDIIAFKEIPPNDPINIMPPLFVQDILNLEDCALWYQDDRGPVKARPEDCVGLERFALYSDIHIVRRLLHYYAGTTDWPLEHSKVKIPKR